MTRARGLYCAMCSATPAKLRTIGGSPACSPECRDAYREASPFPTPGAVLAGAKRASNRVVRRPQWKKAPVEISESQLHELKKLRAVVGRLHLWALRHGRDLRPTAGASDSYGDGMREAKHCVDAILCSMVPRSLRDYETGGRLEECLAIAPVISEESGDTPTEQPHMTNPTTEPVDPTIVDWRLVRAGVDCPPKKIEVPCTESRRTLQLDPYGDTTYMSIVGVGENLQVTAWAVHRGTKNVAVYRSDGSLEGFIDGKQWRTVDHPDNDRPCAMCGAKPSPFRASASAAVCSGVCRDAYRAVKRARRGRDHGE